MIKESANLRKPQKNFVVKFFQSANYFKVNSVARDQIFTVCDDSNNNNRIGLLNENTHDSLHKLCIEHSLAVFTTTSHD